MAAEGVFPKADGDVLYASEINDLETKTNAVWTKVYYEETPAKLNRGLLKFTDDIWQTDASRTTDGGVTWSASGASSGYGGNHIAATSGSVGVSVNAFTKGDSLFTVDNGATWTPANVGIDLDSKIHSISMFGSVAVVCGDDAAATSINYSHDYGNNWAIAASGPSIVMQSIAMANSLIGCAVKSNSLIVKTADGGINWVSTGSVLSSKDRMIAADTDTLYGNTATSSQIRKFIISTGEQTVLMVPGLSNTVNAMSNFVIATNRNLYWMAFAGAQSDGTDGMDITLWRYDGTNFYNRVIGKPSQPNAKTSLPIDTDVHIQQLIEYSNVLTVNISGRLLTVDVSADATGTV